MPSPLDSRRVGWIAGSNTKATASFRLRTLRPVELLKRAGVSARIITDGDIDGYDVVVFQKAYENRHLELADRLRRIGRRVVFDVCDNHLYNPTGDPAKADRASRMREMLDLADVVSYSTDVLRGIVGRDGVVVPDALETPPRWVTRIAQRRRTHRREDSMQLVWMGNAGEPETGWGLVSLLELTEPLSELAGLWDLRLTIITNDRDVYADIAPRFGCATRFVRWRLATAGLVYANCDVALIPVGQNDFTLGKTSNRLATSILLGVPAVVSPLPAYRDYSGATLFEDWTANVERYRRDPDLVTAHLVEGRAIASRLHGDPIVRARWEDVLSDAARNS